jgi:hypothetical protein
MSFTKTSKSCFPFRQCSKVFTTRCWPVCSSAAWYDTTTINDIRYSHTGKTSKECTMCLVLGHSSLASSINAVLNHCDGNSSPHTTHLQEMLPLSGWSPDDLVGSTARPPEDAQMHLTFPFPWSALLLKAIPPFTFGLPLVISAAEGSGDSRLTLFVRCTCFSGTCSCNMSEGPRYRSESRLIFGNSRSSELSSHSTFTCT